MSEGVRVAQNSAGLLLHRRSHGRIEVLLVHPGGPFWARKDDGVWSIPKGVYDPEVEEPLAAALREFAEETGHDAPEGEPLDLGSAKQPSGKVVRVFALAGDLDTRDLRSNSFEIEWPPRSGRISAFPEVDRGAWFDLGTARVKLLPGQTVFLDQLAEALAVGGDPATPLA